MKCQGRAILFRNKCNSLYPSDLQQVIKFWEIKLLHCIKASIHYKRDFAITMFNCIFSAVINYFMTKTYMLTYTALKEDRFNRLF